MATPNLTEIAATTIRHRNKEFADNVTNHNALLKFLEQRGNIKPVSGGRTIVEEVEWAENSTAGFYSGYEVLDTTPQDTLSAAEYDWKQASVQVTASGLEVRVQNRGPEAVIDLLDSRIENAMHSMANLMATSVYSDGTGSGGKEIGGLQLLVADDPTASSTVGGINQANYAFWRNKVVADAAVSASNIGAQMQKLWIQTIRGVDKPDLIVGDANFYNFYWNSLTDLQRFTDDKTAGLGFTNIMFNSCPVVYDDNCPTNHMYFLNTKYLYLRPAAGTQYEPLPERNSVNQDAMVLPIVWAGNLTTNGRRFQGVLKNA